MGTELNGSEVKQGSHVAGRAESDVANVVAHSRVRAVAQFHGRLTHRVKHLRRGLARLSTFTEFLSRNEVIRTFVIFIQLVPARKAFR